MALAEQEQVRLQPEFEERVIEDHRLAYEAVLRQIEQEEEERLRRLAEQAQQARAVDERVVAQHRQAYEAVLRLGDQAVITSGRPIPDANEEERARSAWLEWRSSNLGQHVQTSLQTAEAERANTGMRVEQIVDRIKNVRGQQKDSEAVLAQAKTELAEVTVDEEAIQTGLEELLAHPAVVGLQVEDGENGVTTYAVMRVFGGDNGLVYDLGDWRLALGVTEGLHMEQLRSGYKDESWHPNAWGRNLTFCTSCQEDTRQEATLALKEGRWVDAVNGVLKELVHMPAGDLDWHIQRSILIADEVPVGLPRLKDHARRPLHTFAEENYLNPNRIRRNPNYRRR